ncbi:arginine--tRNA ligase [Conexibacter sp. SYSU D00693]|uniref:arginine--tRNA ligase n=1 Tax=Conexibacter sp. SYSU D00693 TaxID=2812560 RepID=UPI00196A4ED2|nr:arginine--tRNA ligase [Conexibacter sp. SYSU D00693]
MSDPIGQLRGAVEAAMRSVTGDGLPEKASRFSLERPRQAAHGDYATNAAMLLAGAAKAPPREVAERLAAALADDLGERLAGAEVAGPGFLNLRLADAWYADALGGVLADERFGAGGAAAPEQVNVEFVSANPTGPLHVGHARNAAYGDALARVLAFHGHRVDREYYVNDFGSQVANLGRSIIARAQGEEVPEDGYVGAYVKELAAELGDRATGEVADVAQAGVEAQLERIRASLDAFRVHFDRWFSERSLHESPPEPSAVDHGFEVLADQGRTYESEGALWLRTTEFGDDKDRVLRRSSGEHTYFASDIGYLQHKRERGYDRLIYVLGADHHGYIGRMQAAFRALGGDPERLELLIMQFVHLVSGGERLSMSKRAGSFETLDDLVRAVGVDAARWFLLNRSHDTTIEFDLDLAVRAHRENPVFYVQYAHARMCSIEARATATPSAQAAGELHESERVLVRRLLTWPEEVREAADRRAPHRIATYVLELAQDFSAFYRDCLVVGAPEEAWRLAVVQATRRTVAQALELLGVCAPERMDALDADADG